MHNKKGFEFSFGWIFSIIVGGFLIFLAIYAASKFVTTEKEATNTIISKEVGVLLNPLSTTLEDSKVSKINFRDIVRIYNSCNLAGNFGLQKISISTRSGIGEEWSKPGVPTDYSDKYVFSEKIVEGEKINVLSESFNFPFKTADYVVFWGDSKDYCFVNPPSFVDEDIKSKGFENVNISLRLTDCKKGDISVCFSSSGCDIDVNLQAKSVKKTKTVYFTDELIYAAIFSDSDIYECQVKRMLKRNRELSLVYLSKIELNSGKGGCGNSLSGAITNLVQSSEIESSVELKGVELLAKDLGDKNEQISYCKIF